MARSYLYVVRSADCASYYGYSGDGSPTMQASLDGAAKLTLAEAETVKWTHWAFGHVDIVPLDAEIGRVRRSVK